MSANVKVDAGPTIVPAMMVMMAPPVAMTPATPMYFDNIRGFGSVDCCAVAGKRTRSLRNGKQQRGSDADGSESFVHHESFRFFLAADQHSPRA
jgi:hypothetical protein